MHTPRCLTLTNGIPSPINPSPQYSIRYEIWERNGTLTRRAVEVCRIRTVSGMALPHGVGSVPLSTTELMSLVGETMNLASCGAFLGAILAAEDGDWWAPVDSPNNESIAGLAPPAQVKKRRMFWLAAWLIIFMTVERGGILLYKTSNISIYIYIYISIGLCECEDASCSTSFAQHSFSFNIYVSYFSLLPFTVMTPARPSAHSVSLCTMLVPRIFSGRLRLGECVQQYRAHLWKHFGQQLWQRPLVYKT